MTGAYRYIFGQWLLAIALQADNFLFSFFFFLHVLKGAMHVPFSHSPCEGNQLHGAWLVAEYEGWQAFANICVLGPICSLFYFILFEGNEADILAWRWSNKILIPKNKLVAEFLCLSYMAELAAAPSVVQKRKEKELLASPSRDMLRS